MTDLLTAPPEVGEPEPEPTRPDPAVAPQEPDGGWDRVRVIESLRCAAARAREAEVDQYALIAAAIVHGTMLDRAFGKGLLT